MTYVKRSPGAFEIVPSASTPVPSFYIPPGGEDGQSLVRHGPADRMVAWRKLAKADIGLGLVDNTPDSAKPISELTAVALAAKLASIDPRVLSSLRMTPGGTAVGYGAVWDFHNNNLRLRFTAENDAAGSGAVTAWTIDPVTGKVVFEHDVEIKGNFTLPDGSAIGNVQLDAANVFTKPQSIRNARATAAASDADLSLRAQSASGAGAFTSIHFGDQGTDFNSIRTVQWGLRTDNPLFGAFSPNGTFLWGFRPNMSETYLPGNVKIGIPVGQSALTGTPSLNVGVVSGSQSSSVSINGGDASNEPSVTVSGTPTNIGLRFTTKGTGKLLWGSDEIISRTGIFTLTNKAINWGSNTITLTSAQLYTALADKQGSGGSVVFATGATLTGAMGDSPASNDDSQRLATTNWVRSQGYRTGNQSITFTGDATGSGTTNVALTLADTGISAGWHIKVRYDSKGRALEATSLLSSDIPSLTSAKISDFTTQVRSNRLDQMAVPTAAVDLNGQRLTGLADPAAATDAVNKRFVEALIQGLDPKGMVHAASTGNLTLSGEQTVDGVALVAGQRALAKNQTNPAENGIYVVAAGAWARAIDADTWYELSMGYTIVSGGTTNKGSGFYFRVGESGTLGTDPLIVDQFSLATETTVGVGLVKQGNEISVGAGEGLSATSGNVALTGQALKLHQHTGQGFMVRLTNGNFVNRYYSFGEGFTVSNQDAVAGNPSVTLSPSLRALAAAGSGVDQISYYNSGTTATLTALRAYGRTVMGMATKADLQAELGTVPTGGTAGQAMIKTSTTNYAASWQSLTTQMVSEHSSALYFTNARARDAVIDDTDGSEQTDRAPSARRLKALETSTSNSLSSLDSAKIQRENGRGWSSMGLQQGNTNAGKAAVWNWNADIFQFGFTASGSALAGPIALSVMNIDSATGKITIPVDVEFTGAVTGAGTGGGGGGIDPSVSNTFTAKQAIHTARNDAVSADRAWDKAQLQLATPTDTDSIITLAMGRQDTPASFLQFGINYQTQLVGWFSHDGVFKAGSKLDLSEHYQGGIVKLGMPDGANLATKTPSLVARPGGVGVDNYSYAEVRGGINGAGTIKLTAVSAVGGMAGFDLIPSNGGTVMYDGVEVVGVSRTQTLTNKTINWGSNTILLTAAQLAAQVAAKTGTGNLVFANSPVLTNATAAAGPASNSNDLTLTTTAWVNTKVVAVEDLLYTPYLGDVTGGRSGRDANVTLTLPNIVSPGWASRVQYNAKGQVIGAAQLAEEDIPTISSSKISNFDAQVRSNRLDQMAAPTAAVSLGNQILSNVADPLNPQDAANRRFVQAMVEGLDAKKMVDLATTENITLSGGFFIVDGWPVTNNLRILVKNQTNPAENGIYNSDTSGPWTRAEDANTWYELSKAYTIIATGETQKGNGYFFNVGETGTLGTDPLVVEQFSSATSNTFGNGLIVEGNAVSVKAGAGIEVTSDGVKLTGRALQFHSINSNGLIARNSWGEVASRTIRVAPLSQQSLTVSNGDGVEDPTFVVNNTLNAIAGSTPTADTFHYFTSATTASMAWLSAYSRTMLALSNKAAWQAEIGVVPTGGTATQALLKVNGTNYNSAWTSLTTDHVSEGSTRKYYSAATARTDLIATGVYDGFATDKAPSQNAVRSAFEALGDEVEAIDNNANTRISSTAIELPNGFDLNLGVGGGFYTTGTSVTNGPASNAGINANLMVMPKSTGRNQVVQVLVNANNETHTRVGTYGGSSWTFSAWKASGGASGLTKADVGLPNVDNTSDAAKPLSDATKVALTRQEFTETVISSRTLLATDAGKEIPCSAASAQINITVPHNSSVNFPVGTIIEIARWGSGAVAVVAGANVQIVAGNNCFGSKIADVNGSVTIKKRSSGATDVWVMYGGVQ